MGLAPLPVPTWLVFQTYGVGGHGWLSQTCRIHGLNLEHVTLPLLQVRDLGEVEGWASVSTEDKEDQTFLQPWPWAEGSLFLLGLSRVQAAPACTPWTQVPVRSGSLHGDCLPPPWALEFCPLNSSPASPQGDSPPSCAPTLLHPSPQREAGGPSLASFSGALYI